MMIVVQADIGLDCSYQGTNSTHSPTSGSVLNGIFKTSGSSTLCHADPILISTNMYVCLFTTK